MTQDEIISMAHVVGVVEFLYSDPHLSDAFEFLQRFAALVADSAAAKEREACAQTCEERHANGNYQHDTRHECAEAIRARGQH